MDLEKIGEVGELLNDMSPFQVGTRGKYQKLGFTLLGRIKVGYSGGMWSEWYALMDDGRPGWLGEAQGMYMFSFKVDDYSNPPFHELRLGQNFQLRGLPYVVEDARNITYLGSEGELPYVFKANFKGQSVDLRGPGGQFANFLYGPHGNQMFMGEYLPFDDYEFDFLREIDGW